MLVTVYVNERLDIDMAASLRDEARDLRILRKSSSRVTRGAFGPTFGPESEETPAEPKEPTEDRRAKAKPRYERQNRSNPRKRGRPATEEGCYACGSRSHSVPKCYYVNKSIAPATFRGNPTIQLGIEARLQKDTAFAEEIKRQIKPKEEFNDKQ